MRLFRRGDDDALIQEAWFIGWLAVASVAAYRLGGGAAVVLTHAVIYAVRAERSLS